MAEPIMMEGMMAPPMGEDPMMEDEGELEPQLAPEEVEEIQSLVDSSPALAKFIDMIAKEDPMEYGISTAGTAPEMGMGGEAPPMPMEGLM